MSFKETKDFVIGFESCEDSIAKATDALAAAKATIKEMKEGLDRLPVEVHDKPLSSFDSLYNRQIKLKDYPTLYKIKDSLKENPRILADAYNEKKDFCRISHSIVRVLKDSVQPKLTFTALRQLTDGSVTKSTFDAALDDLIKRELVVREGSVRGVFYALSLRSSEIQSAVTPSLIFTILGKQELFRRKGVVHKGAFMKASRLAMWCGLGSKNAAHFALLVQELVTYGHLDVHTAGKQKAYRLPLAEEADNAGDSDDDQSIDDDDFDDTDC